MGERSVLLSATTVSGKSLARPPIALLAVAFFGFCAVAFAYLLIIRGRTSAAP
jgi:hypothetical protein